MPADFDVLFQHIDVSDVQAVMNAINEFIASQTTDADDEHMVLLAIALATANVVQGAGGLYAALLIDINGDVPKVVGVGCDRAAQTKDPSAHAEIEALRHAAQKLGFSDMSGLVMVASGECCPMCLAVSAGAGIAKAMYGEMPAALSEQHAVQYALCELSDDRLMTHISDDVRDEMLCKLEGHGAVVLDKSGRVLAFGDADTQRDPAALASVEAVRGALSLSAARWLPEGSTLVCYHKPHLAGLMVADSARLLRLRSASNPHHPQQDAATPNPVHVCYLIDASEQIIVRDERGQDGVAHDADAVRALPSQVAEQRFPPSRYCSEAGVQQKMQALMSLWLKDLEAGVQVSY